MYGKTILTSVQLAAAHPIFLLQQKQKRNEPVTTHPIITRPRYSSQVQGHPGCTGVFLKSGGFPIFASSVGARTGYEYKLEWDDWGHGIIRVTHYKINLWIKKSRKAKIQDSLLVKETIVTKYTFYEQIIPNSVVFRVFSS